MSRCLHCIAYKTGFICYKMYKISHIRKLPQWRECWMWSWAGPRRRGWRWTGLWWCAVSWCGGSRWTPGSCRTGTRGRWGRTRTWSGSPPPGTPPATRRQFGQGKVFTLRCSPQIVYKICQGECLLNHLYSSLENAMRHFWKFICHVIIFVLSQHTFILSLLLSRSEVCKVFIKIWNSSSTHIELEKESETKIKILWNVD